MGSLNFSASSLLSTLVDIVGYKCGVAVSTAELKKILASRGHEKIAQAGDDTWIRLHSTEFEEINHDILKHFGRISEEFERFGYMSIRHKYKNDKAMIEAYDGVMELYSKLMPVALREAVEKKQKSIDPTEFMAAAFDRYGMPGVDISMAILRNVNEGVIASPWGPGREVEWTSQIELRGLFEQEGLNAQYGNFFDQRYIDFLHRNFEEIDRMHWRKFEQMTAEYLDREGYEVDMGPGRGDDGVDVRAWSRQDRGDAPQIIVQCKRQKANVEKVVIKALYADVLHESARSGLLVTTSRIAPGAEDTRIARAYPIDVADRRTLKEWLERLRSPGSGGI